MRLGHHQRIAKAVLVFLPESWWAYSYPHNVLNEGIQLENCGWIHCKQLIPKVFPTPLYESILAFMIAGILLGIAQENTLRRCIVFYLLLVEWNERYLYRNHPVNPL
ncbi:MAG: hypothetical protein IPG87_13000 [Saprospiraceae bacterium]|nr:hypothetical protein [Candidatus Vicinibacter affinis]